VEQILQLYLLDRELCLLQGIDANHGDDRPGHPVGGQQRDRPAHRVADEDHALQAQRLDHRLDVAGQAVGGPRLAALAGLAVPGLVEGDDAVIGSPSVWASTSRITGSRSCSYVSSKAGAPAP
jgi:hypothetical protein